MTDAFRGEPEGYSNSRVLDYEPRLGDVEVLTARTLTDAASSTNTPTKWEVTIHEEPQ
jgi:hypothetical protein